MPENLLIDSLKKLCAFLNKSDIDYMLIGGLAVGIWDKPRATIDLDFLVLVDPKDFSILRQELAKSKKFIFIHEEIMTFGKVSILRAVFNAGGGLCVDFILSDDDFKRNALKRKLFLKAFEFPICVITPEDLILLKLLSQREQDLLDAKNVFSAQRKNLDITYIKRWSKKLGIKPRELND